MSTTMPLRGDDSGEESGPGMSREMDLRDCRAAGLPERPGRKGLSAWLGGGASRTRRKTAEVVDAL